MTEYYNKDITLAYEDGSSNVSIGEVKAITPPAPTSADLETTTFSTSDYRTHMQGLKDLAPMTFTVNFDSSNNTTNYHSAMITLLERGQILNSLLHSQMMQPLYSMDMWQITPSQPQSEKYILLILHYSLLILLILYLRRQPDGN